VLQLHDIYDDDDDDDNNNNNNNDNNNRKYLIAIAHCSTDKSKDKGKVHPRTGQKGQEEE
jgi:hypothetical protein